MSKNRNIVGVAGHAAKSVVKTTLGVDRLNADQIKARLDICRQCPGNHAEWKKGDVHTCGPMLKSLRDKKRKTCGCILCAKARDRKEDCPFGYWPKLEQKAGTSPPVPTEEQSPAPPQTFASPSNYVFRPRRHHERRVLCRAERHEVIAELRQNYPRLSDNITHAINPSTPSTSAGKGRASARNKSLYDWFDRVVVINLDRRPDRWERLQRHLSEVGWPFRWPERVRAVDGRLVKPPQWWGAGAGAWGCHQSHVRVLEQAMMDGVRALLVLEDDLCLRSDFRVFVDRFLNAIPSDWDQLYLGGQHLFKAKHPPQCVNEEILLAYNVNRTHGYAVSDRFMPALYKHLTDYAEHAARNRHHVDHRMGVLHQTGKYRIYAPTHWLCGQEADISNIKGTFIRRRFWGPSASIQHTTLHKGLESSCPTIAVIGPYRSGTSCLAGILNHLGGHAGSNSLRKNRFNPKGLFESPSLARQCKRMFLEPSMQQRSTFEERVSALRQWKAQELLGAQCKGRFLIAKHPMLCMLCDELDEAFSPNVQFISIYRPYEDSLASLNHVGWWQASNRRHALDLLWLEREKGLSSREHLKIRYEDLLAEPRVIINQITDFLKLSPTPDQIEQAIAFIDPSLNHFTRMKVL